MNHHPRTLTITDPAPPVGAVRGDAPPVELHAAWMPIETGENIRNAWQDLAARALEPNIFYEPAFALPAAKVFGHGVGLVTIRGGDGRLLGLFPMRAEPRRYGLGPSILAGWTHPYAPLGTPLVDRDAAAPAIAAWLDFLASHQGKPQPVLLPYLPTEGPFAAALRSAIAARGAQYAAFGAHSRAMLVPGADRAAYLKWAVSRKKRKELNRQRRRLSDHVPLTVAVGTEPDAIRKALDAFMALEATGWKGRAGTAASHDPAIAQFMRSAVGALALRWQARVEILSRGDAPVAAAIMLRSGANAWFWKIAYDEHARRASPGVQMALELTRSLLADASVAQCDSCATPNHSMIDHIWRERLALADLLIAPPGAPFALTRTLEHARRAAIAAAKWARDKVRGR